MQNYIHISDDGGLLCTYYENIECIGIEFLINIEEDI